MRWFGEGREEKNKMQSCIKCQTPLCTCALGSEVSVLFYEGAVMILCCLGFCLSKEP